MGLRIGAARIDITPPVGIQMTGFAGRDESVEVHDPLTASALVFEEGEGRAVLVCMDLLSLSAETVAQFRRTIASAAGIPSDRIALTWAHNHYGPAVDGTDMEMVQAYRNNLRHLLAGLVYQAAQKLQPARLGVGWGCSGLGVNRREKRPDGQIVLGRNPDGPVDRQVGVLRIEAENGRPLATLVNFACHPVSQGRKMCALSADYPGRMRQVVEGLTGAPCLFLQGACGNIDPIIMEHAYESARTLGTRLGCEVVRVWETIETEEAAGLQVCSRTLSLPRYRYGSAENAARLKQSLEKELERTPEEASLSARWWIQHRLERLAQVLESWRGGGSLPPVEAEVQAWRLGVLGVAMTPGEIFNEIGRRVKERSPFAHTFFAGYANGSIGYVPVREAYAEGGYEVLHACQVDPEAGEQIEETCLELLHSLA